MTTRPHLLALVALLAACSAGETTGVDPDPDASAPVDVTTREDAPIPDVAVTRDVTLDSPLDASLDASLDTSLDASLDSSLDSALDAAPDARADAAPRVDVMPTDLAPMFPAYLHDGRTYDQERDYIAWEGPVNTVSLRHRDGTTLPASEGGASCSATCTETVTRIANGGRIRGRFTYVQSFSVQIASTSDPGAGAAIIDVCGTTLPRITLGGGTSSTPGFTNQPQPAFAVPTAGDCAWSVRAEGGYVDLRAVTVQFRGDGPPTVDLRVDGVNGPVSYDAPATFLLSWTSTSASRCTASGEWNGAREITGSARLADVATGTHTYTVTCENGAGSASDTVMVFVRQPPA